MGFEVGEANPNYKSVNGLLLSKDGEELIAGVNGEVAIPNSVTTIVKNAFYNFTGLTSVSIPNSVTSIGSRAFSGCSGLTSVTIPDSVTNIGTYAFYGCSGLLEFVVDEANPNYKSVNGLLFSKNVGELILGVNGEVSIPYRVTSIGRSAF